MAAADTFAATGAEHSRNVQRYLERLRAAPPDSDALADAPAAAPASDGLAAVAADPAKPDGAASPPVTRP